MLRIVGFVIILFSILGGFVLAQGKLRALWQPVEILIILGSAVGAFMVANPVVVQKMTIEHLKYVMKTNNQFDKGYFLSLLKLLFNLVDLQRKEGANAIENHIEEPHDSEIFERYPDILNNERLLHFVTDNFRVASMGSVSAHEMEALMDHEIHTMSEDFKRPGKALQDIADACPGFGIVAAVMGIVVTMGAIDGPIELIGMKVAAALVGTFLGIIFCYALFGPLATAITHTTDSEMLAFECIKVVLASHLSGQPPLMSVDSGRRALFNELRPTFVELETWLRESPAE